MSFLDVLPNSVLPEVELNRGESVASTRLETTESKPVEARFGFDPILQRLIDTPHEAPLTIQRFCNWSGHHNAVEAIQKAIAHLLNCAEALPTDGSTHVSVAALCQFLGVTIRGSLPCGSSKRIYSTSSPTLRGSRRTGRLQMTPSGPIVLLPNTNETSVARLALAHEIGHLLLLRRENSWDTVSWGMPSTPEEEALAEYAARLLLLPLPLVQPPHRFDLAEGCVYLAGTRCVTIHSITQRLRDIDIVNDRTTRVRAAILWRIAPQSASDEDRADLAPQLTPQWFICPNTFIPVGRCRARARSLVASLCQGEQGETAVRGEKEEIVSIGNLKGRYLVNAFAWGSMKGGRRVVLSLFLAPV